jgi:hypothetical protein
LAISYESKLDWRSHGTSIAIVPVSVITVSRPYSVRDMLAQMGDLVCRTPEEFKA